MSCPICAMRMELDERREKARRETAAAAPVWILEDPEETTITIFGEIQPEMRQRLLSVLRDIDQALKDPT